MIKLFGDSTYSVGYDSCKIESGGIRYYPCVIINSQVGDLPDLQYKQKDDVVDVCKTIYLVGAKVIDILHEQMIKDVKVLRDNLAGGNKK